MIKEFKHYLKIFRDLVQNLPIDHPVYAEGSTVGQIAFHAAQSTNNFLRNHVLRIGFDRNKEAEYGEPHTLDEVNRSIDMAYEACDILEKEKPDLSLALVNPIEMKSAGFTVGNNLEALTFGLSHL